MTTNTKKTTMFKINLDDYDIKGLCTLKDAITAEIDKRKKEERNELIEKLLELLVELDDKYGWEEVIYCREDITLSWGDLYKEIKENNF